MTSEEKNALYKKIDLGVRRAAAKAHAEHKRAGRPIYIWENGEVVEVPPDQIDGPPCEENQLFATDVNKLNQKLS